MNETVPNPETLKFGETLGIAPGNVPVYSSDYQTVDSSILSKRHDFRSDIDDIYMGHKWQCVELARRFLYVNYGYIFDEVAMAYEIFELQTVTRIADGHKLPLYSFRNGSQRRPAVGDLLIWNEGGEFNDTGHVAIVTEVRDSGLKIVEQNYHHERWADGTDFSREIEARVAFDGGYWLRCPPKQGTILGWVSQTDDSTFAEPRLVDDARLFQLKHHEIEEQDRKSTSWLNEANPDEAAFVAMMKGHTLVDDKSHHYTYLSMSESLDEELKLATQDLHALFMHATDWVMQNDDRRAAFNLPNALWPRIKRSWDNRRNEMITGRFDFSVSAQGIKVYEYNCDSASCHMECGKVQGLWANHFGCKDSTDPGKPLFEELTDAWKKSDINGVMHLMHDDDPEEKYHALYMRESLESAGISCKTLCGTDELKWGNAGEIADDDDTPIKWVWKTWSWETALDQIRQACEDDDLGLVKQARPRLVDVLLREDVRVFEPLWTLIPSNKAILPILWKLFPNHPYLLESTFELTDTLRKKGYVSKPIVGRCGKNIALYGAGETLLAETQGQFDSQDQIFQAYSALPVIENHHVQLCTFSVAGLYGGCCTRVDKSPVIRWDSDIWPLRIQRDSDFLSED